MRNKIEIKTGVAGRFTKIEVLNADGELLRELEPFNNLILDTGMSRLALVSHLTDVPIYTFCRVGSGQATPLVTDQSLQDQVASTGSTTFVNGRDLVEGYCFQRITYTFGLGAAAGNLSEIGTGWSASGLGSLFSRARILDGNGNPTTITILADEILRVTWEFRVYWPTQDSTGELLNGGNKGGTYNWCARAARIGSWTRASNMTRGALGLNNTATNQDQLGGNQYYVGGQIGALTGIPTGVAGPSQGGIGVETLPTTGFKSLLRLSFNTSQGNTVGIKCFKFGVSAQLEYQVEFTPALVKTSEDLMHVDLSHSWGRR